MSRNPFHLRLLACLVIRLQADCCVPAVVLNICTSKYVMEAVPPAAGAAGPARRRGVASSLCGGGGLPTTRPRMSRHPTGICVRLCGGPAPARPCFVTQRAYFVSFVRWPSDRACFGVMFDRLTVSFAPWSSARSLVFRHPTATFSIV